MLWRTHLAMGLAAGYMVAGPDPVSLTAAGIAALLPDLDHSGSYAGRRAPVLSTMVRISFGHRGALHSLVAAAAAALAVGLAGGPALALAAGAGYLAHLLGDLLTPSGVPLLWPWPGRVRVPLVRTGGLLERYVVFPVAALGFAALTMRQGLF